MRIRRASCCWALAACLALPCLTSCGDDATTTTPAATSTRTDTPRAAGSASPTPRPAGAGHARDTRVPRARDAYESLAARLHAHGVRIWWESDLVARWLEGPASFAGAVRRLGALARQPGTAGFKVADEIGYHDGLKSPAQALAFLRDVHKSLGAVAPGKAILVDAVVLELGCLPRISSIAECERRARADAPAATISALTSYLQAGLIDALDLSTGLGEASEYPNGNLAAAQDLAWTYVAAGSWPHLTRLQARKALAQVGGYRGRPAADLKVYVDTPRRHGARAVDIWTWRQNYQDETVSLLGSSPTSNPLWNPLLAERRRGVPLFTHMTPSTMPTQPGPRARECALAARIFTDVFVAAGTG